MTYLKIFTGNTKDAIFTFKYALDRMLLTTMEERKDEKVHVYVSNYFFNTVL